MKIAIGITFTRGGKRGGDVYVQELVRALGRVDRENRYLLFGYVFRGHAGFAAELAPLEGPNVRLAVRRWPQGLVGRAEGWGLPVSELFLRSRGVDLYHSPGPALPPLRRLRAVVSVHDLMPWSRPDLVPPESREHWRAVTRDAVERADAVLASSSATRDDILRCLGTPAERVRVAILGVNREAFRPIEDAGRLRAVRERLRLPERFVLTAGPYEPRRDWETILRALARPELEREGLAAVFTGGGREADMARLDDLAAGLGLRGRALRVGYVPREDLAALYNLASAFVYPSLYDGFNLPVIEAMACGTPVVASEAGALKEILGGAARAVKPGDPGSVAEGILDALEPAHRALLRERGLRRAGELSWDAVARATLEAYRAALR